MSDASSAVTYTSVYMDFEPWRYYGEDSAETGPPRVSHTDMMDSPYSQSKEEPFEDDDEEEEEHPASADSSVEPIVDLILSAGKTEALEADEPTHAPGSPISIPLSQTRLRRARKTVRPEPPMSASMEACIARHAAFPLPPPLVPSLPLPFPSPLTTSPTDTGAPLGYRAVGIRIRALLLSTSRRTNIPEADMLPQKRACLTAPTPRFNIGEISATGAARQPGPTKSDHRRSPTTLEGVNERVTELDTIVRKRTDKFEKMAPKKRTTRGTPATTNTPTITVTNAQLQALIDRGVAAALAERDADRSRNGNNSNDSGIGGRRQMTTPRECSYTNFLKCQPMSFQGTEGVVGSALTWWNSYMRAVRQDVAYAMPWAALKKMITKAEKVERYIGGLPDMIHGSVKASKPQSMHEAIEFATEMMDKKMLTHAKRQAEQKRKLDDTSRNNQHQQQPFKRNDVARAYTAGPGDKKPYGGIKPLCPKMVTKGIELEKETLARAYAVGTAETNPNSNVVTGTFLLNNRYALVLFETGADRNFVSTAFSSLIDIIPTTLDYGYDVELVDGRII
nr:hypothetical protein [Tanacetum cinerariifolium]